MSEQQYYVYALIDPRSMEPFYIGKGCRDRMYQHVKNARRGQDCNPGKMLRILEIERAGHEVIHRKLAEFDSGLDALVHEKRLVAETPGLTNIAPGGGGGPTLSPAELERRAAESKRAKIEATRDWLRRWLRWVDTWPNGATAPGVRDGDRLGAEIVQAVRELVAEPLSTVGDLRQVSYG